MIRIDKNTMEIEIKGRTSDIKAELTVAMKRMLRKGILTEDDILEALKYAKMPTEYLVKKLIEEFINAAHEAMSKTEGKKNG